ncbi:glycosyltransferase family 2 protein [Aeromicrobium yanjiei]|uniref:glycosyltransferase family 2 protein n=1 Tax=Aeromicrobium yanjiei TaxID=2662028 RepID=UPI001892AE44|nr:glycosyltransferase family 2 protein [Aeromicrobium yanjiei]
MTYNSAEVLASSWSGVDLTDVHWIVVDNNSSDDSVRVAEKLGAEVISRQDNAGFSSSNNLALAQVDTTWTAFVNPDVTLDAGSLGRLGELCIANNAFVAPQLRYPSGEQQANARGLPTPAAKLSHRGARIPGVNGADYARTHMESPTFVAWLMGAAVCGRTSDFKRIGGWNDDYFIYYEDHEMGLRAWQSGMSVVLDPHTSWIHQWQRETTTLSRSAWAAEFNSAKTFYRAFPDLLTAGRASRSPRFDRLISSLWKEAKDV